MPRLHLEHLRGPCQDALCSTEQNNATLCGSSLVFAEDPLCTRAFLGIIFCMSWVTTQQNVTSCRKWHLIQKFWLADYFSKMSMVTIKICWNTPNNIFHVLKHSSSIQGNLWNNLYHINLCMCKKISVKERFEQLHNNNKKKEWSCLKKKWVSHAQPYWDLAALEFVKKF